MYIYEHTRACVCVCVCVLCVSVCVCVHPMQRGTRRDAHAQTHRRPSWPRPPLRQRLGPVCIQQLSGHRVANVLLMCC